MGAQEDAACMEKDIPARSDSVDSMFDQPGQSGSFKSICVCLVEAMGCGDIPGAGNLQIFWEFHYRRIAAI